MSSIFNMLILLDSHDIWLLRNMYFDRTSFHWFYFNSSWERILVLTMVWDNETHGGSDSNETHHIIDIWQKNWGSGTNIDNELKRKIATSGWLPICEQKKKGD